MYARLSALVAAEIDARPLAIARLLVAAAALIFVGEFYAKLYPGASGEFLQLPVISAAPRLSLVGLYVLLAMGAVAAIALLLGVVPRLAALAVALTSATAMLSDRFAYSNHGVLLVVMCLLLSVSGAGATLAIRAPMRAVSVSFAPSFLLMVLITTLYFWTAASKVNPQYISGAVIGQHLQPWVPALPASALSAMAIASIVVEFTLAGALWWQRSRPYAFVLGALLHLGILVLMAGTQELFTFALLMGAGYAQFGYLSMRGGFARVVRA